jgi:hypothetical protein
VVSFNAKYGDDLFRTAYLDKERMNLFVNELILFCNENQFIRYITKTFQNIYVDFLRKHYYEINNCYINFDTMKIETNQVYNNCFNNSLFYDAFDFEEEDLIFLKLFIENGNVLSEREVGIKLGISQQAVNKRKKSIYKKYQTRNNL